MAQAFQCKTWVQRQETERDSLSRRGSALANDFEALPHDWTRCGKNLDGDDSLPQGLKPSLILPDLRGAKAPLYHSAAGFRDFFRSLLGALRFPQPVKLECLRNETEDPGQAYRGQSEVIIECAPQARDCTHRRYRYKDGVDEVERAKNRSKSTVRSKVEHVFAVMKLKFGFVKLRFRGLQKNATQLFAVCALVNLYLARKKLLLLAPA